MNSLTIATDLDQTMIYSTRSLKFNTYHPSNIPDLHPIEFDGQYTPMSYVTTKAHQLLKEIRKETLFIPTTTRTLEQYRRLVIQPAGQQKDTYAITSNGGNILVNGKVDFDWAKSIQATIEQDSIPLHLVNDYIIRKSNESWVEKVRIADDLFIYLVLHREKMPKNFLTETTLWLAERGWGVSLQGKKLYLIPDSLTKERAVAEVIRRTTTDCLITAGDSLLDMGLLNMADYAYRPAHGELDTVKYQSENLIITKHAGILAGEEILEAMIAHC